MKNSRLTLLTLFFTAAAFTACASVPSKELVSARAAYKRAAAGSAATMAPSHLDDAKKALARAEKEFADNPGEAATRDYAYIAQRRAQLAEVKASTQSFQDQKGEARTDAAQGMKDNLSRTKEELAATKDQNQAAEHRLALGEQQADATKVELATSNAALAEEKTARLAAEDEARLAQEELAKIASVQKEERGLVISLSGSVLFATNQATLLSNAPAMLDRVADALKKGKASQSITIEGHTDSVGSESANQALSLRRAEGVRDYLVSRGITAKISAIGLGKSRPIADNATAEGRANNRRVEIIVAPDRA